MNKSNSEKTMISDFIKHIVKFDSIDEILDYYNSDSMKGFVYERLWDLIIKFGFCDLFPNHSFHHLLGNLNTGRFQYLSNLDKYVEKNTVSGNSSGCSDISLQNKETEEFIFISSKYYINKDKQVSSYGIQDIISMINKNKNIYTKYKIYLLVLDRYDVLQKIHQSNESSLHITNYMKKENILDKKDLNKFFILFKKNILEKGTFNYTETYLQEKESLKLRFHQKLIIHKTQILMNEGHKSFLWGCKCRSGKTYMIGGLISNQKDEEKKGFNVLIITPAPTETIPQFTDDLFLKFKDFDDFKIHNIENSSYIKNMTFQQNNIIVVSKQLLQKYVGKTTILPLKNLNFNIIVFDENHFGGTTQLSEDILTSYTSDKTIKIYMTATFDKPVRKWNISSDCQIFWDIEDEQACKNILTDRTSIERLKIKHGEIYVDKALEFYDMDTIFQTYKDLPDLFLLTNMFDSQYYDGLRKRLGKDNKYGFCFDTLFSLNEERNRFMFEEEVKTFLQYISGSYRDMKHKEMAIFTRVFNICSTKNSRKPFTQLWFLPSNGIGDISKCLQKFMLDDSVLKKYDILCVNRKNKDLAKDVRDEIRKCEIESKNKGKNGLIILAGDMLSLGITLSLCDLVILLNDSISGDKIMQQIYRCMTEGENKKFGFVIDLNISRVLNTCINYAINSNKSIEDKISYVIRHNLINIDIDIMENKKLNSDTIIKKLIELWKEDPVNAFINLLRNLDNELVKLDIPTQKLLNKTFLSINKKDKISLSVILKDSDEEDQPLPSGREKIENESKEDSEDEESVEKDEEIEISFTRDVLPYIIPLSCILTMKDRNTDIIKMLTDIKENPELLEAFNNQSLIWWNKKDLIDIIKNIIDKYFDKSSNTYKISMQFKLSLQSIIDRPKELLELIDNCLKPKEIEKKKFGEVFTPMNIIEEMLDRLPTEVWFNKNLKWLDPASGMGNFPIAIYLRLMRALEEEFKDEGERKRHIIENMLYMSEINKKNCVVCRQIFDINNEYKLNIYEGDSLKVDYEREFGVKKFDIVVGNPPYNEELKTKKGSASALYNKFIEYFIDRCGMLLFIIPSRWFSGGKGLDDFREMMLNRTDIVFIKHYENACEIFGNTVEIKGGVNYFLINKEYNGLCDFNGSKLLLNKYDVFVDCKYYKIIDKIIKHNSLSKLFIGQSYSGVTSNDNRLSDKNTDTTLLCYVSQQKGFIKYVEKNKITKGRNFNKWKVITTEASFSANSGFGNMFIGKPNEICSQSYIVFETGSQQEATSLLSYMKCKLPNFMLSLRKISQHISEATCKWIPLPPLNKIWNDDDVYKYFKLSQEDIKLINDTKIKGYKDLNTHILSRDKMNKEELKDMCKQLNYSKLNKGEENISSSIIPIERVNKMKKEELKEICRKHKIKGFSTLKIAELKELVINSLK